MELVSAIITTRNRPVLLERAIKSVFDQTYSNIELIVVDDASDDNTSILCEDSRINYIYIPKEASRGGNYARNLGIKASKGEYCAFLDDDDYWLPQKIEKQMMLIRKMECELVYCGIMEERITLKGTKYVAQFPSPSLCGNMKRKILQAIPTTTTNILVRRDALFDVGLFDENLRFWQEYELTIRLAQRQPFFFVNEPLSVYRVDTCDTQRLTNKFYEWKNAVRYIHNKHAELYARLNAWEHYKVWHMIWEDAAKRSKSSGLKWHYIMYALLCTPLNVLRKCKNIFGGGVIVFRKQ